MIMHLFGQNMFPVTVTQVHICQLFKHMDVTFQNIMTKFFQYDILLFFFMKSCKMCDSWQVWLCPQPTGGGTAPPDLQLY